MCSVRPAEAEGPDIEGTKYQQRKPMEFWNVREYVLFLSGHKRFHCRQTDVPLNAPHLEGRKTGGSSPANLIALCEDCCRNSLSKKKQKQWRLPERVPSPRDAVFTASSVGQCTGQYPDVSLVRINHREHMGPAGPPEGAGKRRILYPGLFIYTRSMARDNAFYVI